MAAFAVSVPSRCCSTPRPVRMKTGSPPAFDARAAAARCLASQRMRVAETPETAWARSGHHSPTLRRKAPRPVVRRDR